MFKPDFYRFFALGFAAGAVLVLGALGIGGGLDITVGVLPSAVAAPAR